LIRIKEGSGMGERLFRQGHIGFAEPDISHAETHALIEQRLSR